MPRSIDLPYGSFDSIRFDSISLTCSPTFLFLTISHLPLPYVHFVHFHSLTHYSTKQKEDTHEFVSFHLISVQLVAGTYTFVRCFFEVHEQSWDCNGNVLIMPPLPPSSYCVPHSLFLTCFHFHLPTSHHLRILPPISNFTTIT
jgi:hypothetical protein